MVQRLRPLLNGMISPNQNSFLPRRGTENNYIVASEILHSMRGRKEKKGWMALKIDLKKAYDRLEWDFIHERLISHNLDKHTCSLILSCISSVSSSVIVNGQPTEPFHLSRGIRQGDPLPPYIFIMCMEHLTHIINETVARFRWTPFSFHRNRIHISHFLFANDILLFGEANVSSTNAIIDTLREFHKKSGLKKNPQKTSIYFSRITDPRISSLLPARMNILSKIDLGIYLGFPLTDKRPTKIKWVISGSHIWQDMEKGWDIFAMFSGWCIKKGDCVSFWYDF